MFLDVFKVSRKAAWTEAREAMPAMNAEFIIVGGVEGRWTKVASPRLTWCSWSHRPVTA